MQDQLPTPYGTHPWNLKHIFVSNSVAFGLANCLCTAYLVLEISKELRSELIDSACYISVDLWVTPFFDHQVFPSFYVIQWDSRLGCSCPPFTFIMESCPLACFPYSSWLCIPCESLNAGIFLSSTRFPCFDVPLLQSWKQYQLPIDTWDAKNEFTLEGTLTAVRCTFFVQIWQIFRAPSLYDLQYDHNASIHN